VNWDDGTPVDFFSYPAGTTVFSETHVYANDGEYTIAVTVEDDDLGQDLTDTIVTITNVAPATDAGGPYEIDEGDDLPVSATASDPSPADQGILVYEWDFDSDGFYDDGVGANTTVPWATLAALGLGDDGVYTIGLQVSDDDSSTDSSTTLAINNVSPTVDLGPDITVDEGDDVSINASFSDPGSLDTHSATLQVHGVFTVSVTIIADTTVYEFVATDDGLITVSATIIADTAIYEFVATDDGVFTVTVQVSDDDGGVGSDDLILTINNVPPTADAGGPYEIDEGDDLALAGSGSDVGPVDAAILTYRWDLNDDNSFNDAVSAGPTVPWADLLTLGLGSGVHTITLRVFDDDTSTDDSTTLTISAANTAPVLDAVGDQEVDEETLLAFTATASDADLPAQSLTFSLSGAPAGASIDPITGVFNWTPTEAQGPGEYTFDVVVSDGVASDSETITITVSEVNTAPVLGVIGNASVDEQVTLSFTATASDADLPAQSLTFSLSGAPAGASIDPITGVFNWTPTEAQGPGEYTFDVVVSDGVASDSETITVTVNEVNVAPVLEAIGNQTVDEGDTLAFTATATDADLPADALTFSLTGAVPVGASMTASGEFTWTPTEAQGPDSYAFDVVVTDDGVPALSDSETITVIVNEVNLAPVITSAPVTVATEEVLYSYDVDATDPDGDPLTYALTTSPAGMTIDSATGLVQWTPSATQAGSHNVTVEVSDGRGGSDSQSYAIAVAEGVPGGE